VNCLECGRPTDVIDSRLNPEGLQRRRRACAFGHRFSTTEFPNEEDLARAEERKRASENNVERAMDEMWERTR
jgi:transcriptional regulator NrdR family protein